MATRTALNRDRIVDVAMAMLEDDPSTALSVRDLGDRLGVHATALYRHFRDKDELLRAIGDRILVDVTADLKPTAPWRETVTTVCVRLRAAHLARPVLAMLNQGEPPRQPNELAVTEALLGALMRARLSPSQIASAYHALIELTIGSATIDAALASEPASSRAATYRRWRADYAALDPDEHPASVALAGDLYAGTADDRFEFALDLMLDALARLSSTAGRS